MARSSWKPQSVAYSWGRRFCPTYSGKAEPKPWPQTTHPQETANRCTSCFAKQWVYKESSLEANKGQSNIWPTGKLYLPPIVLQKAKRSQTLWKWLIQPQIFVIHSVLWPFILSISNPWPGLIFSIILWIVIFIIPCLWMK